MSSTDDQQQVEQATGVTRNAPVRPVGTWVVTGFLTLVTLVVWVLVAVIFQLRS
jgi:hypothetical protein